VLALSVRRRPSAELLLVPVTVVCLPLLPLTLAPTISPRAARALARFCADKMHAPPCVPDAVVGARRCVAHAPRTLPAGPQSPPVCSDPPVENDTDERVVPAWLLARPSSWAPAGRDVWCW